MPSDASPFNSGHISNFTPCLNSAKLFDLRDLQSIPQNEHLDKDKCKNVKNPDMWTLRSDDHLLDLIRQHSVCRSAVSYLLEGVGEGLVAVKVVMNNICGGKINKSRFDSFD